MYLIIFSVLIGIFIGALTNALAIKMLFRPYQPWKIGHKTIPFTPGLIPKRRGEIAAQLGQLVENYLFTVEGLREFITNSGLKAKLYPIIIGKLIEIKEEKIPVSSLAKSIYGESWKVDFQEFLEKKLIDFLREEKIHSITLGQIVNNFNMDIEGYTEKITNRFIDELQTFLHSQQGKLWIESVIRSFFNNKGMLGFFANKLLEGDQLQEKISDYFNQILNHHRTKEAVQMFLLKEWEKQTNKTVGETIDKFYPDLKPTLGRLLGSRIDAIADLKLDVLINPLMEKGWGEKGYNLGFEFIFERLHLIFSYFSIGDVVREEVNKFSLPKLEKMIIDVSRKELKMITYLGGVIGGVIGLLQGMIYHIL